jgi:hypothetical protein
MPSGFVLSWAHVQMTADELQQYRDQLLRDHALGPLYVPRRFTALPESGNLSSDLEFRAYGMLREREPTLEVVLTHPSIAIVGDRPTGNVSRSIPMPRGTSISISSVRGEVRQSV